MLRFHEDLSQQRTSSLDPEFENFFEATGQSDDENNASPFDRAKYDVAYGEPRNVARTASKTSPNTRKQSI